MTKHETTLTEETPVKLRMGTAWGIIVSIIATTVWLTALIFDIRTKNEQEHARLLLSLSELNTRSQNWVTKEQVEEALVYVARELHSFDTNVGRWREIQLRDGIRQKLRAPKDTP